MNECLELHKAMSEAVVEYQKKFDEVKAFELSLFEKPIPNILELIDKWDKLKAEEEAARIKRDAAEKEYIECMRRAKT